MRRFQAVGTIAVAMFAAVNVKGQREPELYLPCKASLQVGSAWKETGQNYAKHNRRVMPMTDTKRCDLVFLRSSDSARIRISFCHERSKPTAILQTDSVFSRQIGSTKVQFTRSRMNGRVLYDLEGLTAGCSHAWGTLIREDEMSAMESFLQDLRMEELRD